MNTEILEGNKLIAEFMGYANPHDNTGVLLKYHSSWEWLMPVVEKIESISAGLYHSFSVRIEYRYCGIHCHEKNRQSGIIYQTPYMANPESKIIATWDAVVEFIKWYNLTQPVNL